MSEANAAVRLQKYMAACGVASRRACEEYIRAGRVTVDGAVAKLGQTLCGGEDVRLDGAPVLPATDIVVYAFHKPVGVVSTCADDRGRKTVADYFSDLPHRVYPVGRLDMDSYGLMLLTNDGALANALTHPSREVPKQYQAVVKGSVSDAALRQLREGVSLEDGVTAPAAVELVGRTPSRSTLRITIHEGRNRQVRRMCAAVGHPVFALSRRRIGSLELGELREGKRRRLTDAEVRRLREGGGL